jgi:steroid delta-isomerase-like uncharacterized protein
MTVEQNKMVVKEFVDAVNTRDVQRIKSLVSDDFVGRSPGIPDFYGPQGYVDLYSTFISAFPDMHVVINDMIAEGDKVVVYYTWSGTHQGELEGIPPTGRRVSVPSIDIDRVVGGKIVEEFGLQDNLDLYRQLGIQVEASVQEPTL